MTLMVVARDAPIGRLPLPPKDDPRFAVLIAAFLVISRTNGANFMALADVIARVAIIVASLATTRTNVVNCTAPKLDDPML